MLYSEAAQLARGLMAAHGLHGWCFTFNRRKKGLGLCRYQTHIRVGIIELSMYFVQRNEESEIRNTILHEIAHALVGPGHGHDHVWRATAIRIGARPERCNMTADMPKGRWQATCGGCQYTYDRFRQPRTPLPGQSYICQKCGKDRGKLQFTLVGASSR